MARPKEDRASRFMKSARSLSVELIGVPIEGKHIFDFCVGGFTTPE